MKPENAQRVRTLLSLSADVTDEQLPDVVAEKIPALLASVTAAKSEAQKTKPRYMLPCFGLDADMVEELEQTVGPNPIQVPMPMVVNGD